MHNSPEQPRSDSLSEPLRRFLTLIAYSKIDRVRPLLRRKKAPHLVRQQALLRALVAFQIIKKVFSKPLLICFDLIQKKFAFSAFQKNKYLNSSLDWFSVQESPIVYFDAPIFKGRRKTFHLWSHILVASIKSGELPDQRVFLPQVLPTLPGYKISYGRRASRIIHHPHLSRLLNGLDSP